MENFEKFKLNRQLLNAIEDLGYQEPTEIQEKAIPLVLAGHDILGIAQTGTGKTAAYTLPLLMKIKYAQGLAPRALVLAPTRELCLQIQENIKSLGKYTDLRILAVYGGTGIKTQIQQVKEGVDILVATPGRFTDIYLSNELVTKYIQTLVLDEADKMMDMGFMPQIRKILEVIPSKKRQNLLFSATMPEKVLKLSEEFLEFPMRVEVSPQATTAETIEQILYLVPNFRTKIELLNFYLSQEESFSKVIIFTKTKDNANHIYRFLERKFGTENVKVIHANKDQNARLNAMEAFKNQDVRILVATDLAARGIDVTLVSHVINFDVPLLYEEYVHRIGRTGRANQTGIAITFANEAEIYHIKKIEELIRMEIPQQSIPLEVKIFETDFEEKQAIAREMDKQKRKENPDFKGAFHEKKRKQKPRPPQKRKK
ncbi:MAG: DEAD/DEAH box helicase [Thermonemataceae bacterium]|nr:DEAD/DEAH box helicase [Thermonemataceae bacterium]